MQKTVVTYRGCVKGLQEVLYFNHLQNLINNCDKFNKRVNFNFKNANGGSASKIVHKAKLYSSTDNMKIAVFDHDFKEEDFIKAISDCEKYKIFPAYSNISFNLFLILHIKEYNKKTTPHDNYLKDLKNTYKIGSNVDIKSEAGCLKIINQITLENVETAIINAKKINSDSKQYNKKIINNVYEQPYLNINKFLELVFKELNE